MPDDSPKKIYSIRDLGLAATLVTLGVRFVGLDFQYEGRRKDPVGYWSFEDSPELRQMEQDFLNGSDRVLVHPRSLIINLRALKSQVVSKERAPR